MLFTIAKIGEQPKYLRKNEFKNVHFHTMEYYLPLKMKNILPLVKTRKNLGDIVLSEISQTQKNKYYMIPRTLAI